MSYDPVVSNIDLTTQIIQQVPRIQSRTRESEWELGRGFQDDSSTSVGMWLCPDSKSVKSGL